MKSLPQLSFQRSQPTVWEAFVVHQISPCQKDGCRVKLAVLLLRYVSLYLSLLVMRREKQKKAFTNMLKDGIPTTPYATFEASYTS
jgi:hypothetical protein